jgi:hypothetical protein
MKYEALKLAVLSSGQVYLAKVMREMLKMVVDKENLLFAVLCCFVVYIIVLTMVDRNEGNPYILDVGSKLIVLLMFGTFPTKHLFVFQELDSEIQTLILLVMIGLFQVSFYALPPSAPVKEAKTKVVLVVRQKRKRNLKK